MAESPGKGLINTKQYIWLLFIIITSFTALQVPALIIFQAGRDAWLSIAAVWLVDLLVAVVYAYLAIRFPGQNPVQSGPAILGKTLGNVFGVLFILFFLVVSVTVMRGLGMVTNNVFLPKTPPSAILLGAYLIIAYIARKGIEVIARICEVLGPVFLFSLIGLTLLALPFVDLGNLKPQLDQGAHAFLGGVPLALSFFAICLAMSWYLPHCQRPEDGFWAKLIALTTGASLISLIVICSIGIFGVEQAGNMTNPGLELARIIHVADYFERMETIWMAIATGAGIMMAISAIWIISLSTAQIAGLTDYRPLVYPVALVSFALSLSSFPRNISYLDFIFYTFPVFGLLVETLPIWLLIVALVRKKRGAPA